METDLESVAAETPLVSPREIRGRAPGPPWPPPKLTRGQQLYERLKRGADAVAAACLSVPAVPLLALAAVLVKLTSRGPAFYLQTRVGRRGLPFTVYKLRTMMHDCEVATGPRWAVPGDPRVTRVGWLLRRTHLDELPQLLNILRGEMSLVGPRPERPEFVCELERALPGYRGRLLVRPGITGLAQVQLGPEFGLVGVRRKLALDLFYIQRLGPWLDLRVLAGTLLHALGAPCGLIRRALSFPSAQHAEECLTVNAAVAPARLPGRAA
jgi:lipopolysaccharide/colanic/teichoic acid biosynthesis glycosyltransferase